MSNTLNQDKKPATEASSLVLGKNDFGPLLPGRIYPLPNIKPGIDVGKYLCQPCPFCGSTHLSITDWWDDDGEYDAIECCDCKGCAPADKWNQRCAS